MGSVIDYIDCPNCGSPDCFDDFYYKTGEEYISCNRCGYHRSSVIKMRDKKLSELTESDWEYIECLNPYGAFRYKVEGGVAYHCGTLETEADGMNFITTMESPENDTIEYAAISRFVDGEIKETILINNLKDKEDGSIL